MYQVRKSIEFCYGHRLPNHAGKCRHLHGHTARAEIIIEAEELNTQGMVRDFSEVEQTARALIDADLDHTLLLHREDPLLGLLRQAGERVYVMEEPPTAEHIAHLIFEHMEGAGFPVVEVGLWEGPGSCARYRP